MNRTTKSTRAWSLVCGVGRTPLTRRQLAALDQLRHSVRNTTRR